VQVLLGIGHQNYAHLAILQPPQVGEHACGDAHRRRRERRAHHEPDEWREPERKAGEVAERERHGDTDQRDREGGRPHGEQPAQVGLEANLEQKDDHAKLAV